MREFWRSRLQSVVRIETVLYGIGPTALAFFHEAKANGSISFAAFCCAAAEIESGEYCGLPLVPFEEVEFLYPPEHLT